MAKKKGNDGWWIVGLLAVGGLLYYTQTGLGKEKDSALLPNTLEGKIDALVTELNDRFGKQWVHVGVGVLRYYIQNTLPASFVGLVNIVATVENASKGWMTGPAKQQLAVQMARAN